MKSRQIEAQVKAMVFRSKFPEPDEAQASRRGAARAGRPARAPAAQKTRRARPRATSAVVVSWLNVEREDDSGVAPGRRPWCFAAHSGDAQHAVILVNQFL